MDSSDGKFSRSRKLNFETILEIGPNFSFCGRAASELLFKALLKTALKASLYCATGENSVSIVTGSSRYRQSQIFRRYARTDYFFKRKPSKLTYFELNHILNNISSCCRIYFYLLGPYVSMRHNISTNVIKIKISLTLRAKVCNFFISNEETFHIYTM